jgi:beta-glucanase (GH16 family)
MYTYTQNNAPQDPAADGSRIPRKKQRMAGVALRSFVCLLGSLLASCASMDVPGYDGYVLDWADEFKGKEIDRTIWRHAVGGGGFGNNELQYYTNEATNSRIEDGLLVIEARRERKVGWPYTSAKLETYQRKSILYGRVEVRARLPEGVGSWPAIWMLPEDNRSYGIGWPDSGEIDIVEHVGFDPGVVHFSIHTAAFNHKAGTQKTGIIAMPETTKDFHVYGIEWTPDFIRWYVDGKTVHRFDNPGTGWQAWPFDKPYYLILNIACGGDWGGRQGIDNDSLPWRMEVDWVRVYRLKD